NRDSRVEAADRVVVEHSERCGTYDNKTIAEDVAQLLSELSEARFFVVGHDMGAVVAYALAARYPGRVAGLVVMEMLLPGFGLEEAAAIQPGGTTFWHIPFHLAPASHAEILTRGREELYLYRFYTDSLYNPASFSDEDRAHYVRAYRAPYPMRAGFERYV